ncbi:MAG: hypothetical protein AAF664_14350 [Planctomycetota bacterium]
MFPYSTLKREARAYFFTVATLTSIVVFAYVLVPSGVSDPEKPSNLLTILGIVTFFCLAPLDPKPSPFVLLRSISLSLLCGGILARILVKEPLVGTTLQSAGITISPDRSFEVSAALLIIGFAALTVYLSASYRHSRQKSKIRPMSGSSAGSCIEDEDLSSLHDDQ